MFFYRCLIAVCISLAVLCAGGGFACAEPEQAEQEVAEGGYLAAYRQEPSAQPAQSSGWSLVAYVCSLAIVFGVVVALAYFVSRFMGMKFGAARQGKVSQILDTVSLGPNRGLYVVDIAGKILLLGVTDHQIACLQEITDEMEIAKLRSLAGQGPVGAFSQVFEKQMLSLEELSRRIPTILQDKRDRK